MIFKFSLGQKLFLVEHCPISDHDFDSKAFPRGTFSDFHDESLFGIR